MALDYEMLMGLGPRETLQDLTRRDTMLYALGVGAAADAPTDRSELQFVYEDGLRALPTMAGIMAYPGFWAKDPKYGLDWPKVLHGEQSVEIHRPLPVEGRIRGVTTIDEIYDKGADKGAILYETRKIYDADDEHVATCRRSLFLRGDGGFGGRADGAPRPHPSPNRDPDLSATATTRHDQALLYRLSGDYNPLHADPDVAAGAGFRAPILHGMATYGVAGRVLLKALCANDPARLKRLDARFSSPVYPGETLQVEIWREGKGRAAYRARVLERDVIVLQNGDMEFGD